LGKTFWPTVLACPYPHPGHWELSLVVYSVALIAGLSALAVLYARRYPFFFTGWFWFVGTLIPVIGLVQVGGQPMADRYTYIPLIGLFIAFVWGLGETALSRPVPKTLIVVLTAMILVACAWRTRNQLSYWRDSETLFRHTLAVTKDNYIACNNLGTWLSKRGQIAEAMDYFHKSLKINPDGSDVLYNLANTFAKLGNWDEAITNYQRALQITPNQSDILDNLGFALAAKKQFADAVVCFEAALKLNPDCADAHNNLATVLFIQKKIDGAVRHFREALRLTPGNPQIYSNLADALVKQGQTAEAVRCYQEALRLKPGDPQVRAKLQALGAPISN
jgi:tetratricopeptide (TPR) repeat protein